jgi:hypothetical protein
MKRTVLLGALFLTGKLSIAQNGSIQGSVRYRNDNTPAGYMQVAVVETGQKAICDEQGRFALNNIAPGIYTIQLTYFEHDTIKQTIVLKPEERLTPLIMVNQPQWITDMKKGQLEQARQDSINFATMKRRPKKDRAKY